ncbi:hypothetical protein C8J57DRAFT_43987 [Mycena rebaudengoi]|nr:hypothetical protein C8J57DRAFT_43987 [Mycena rebaudengoi]
MSLPSTAAAGISPDRLANLIMASKSIVAGAELLPFPYLKGALGPVIPILEAVQKMTKNREDFTELCASIVEIITLLQEEISRHGADAASRLTQFCEQLNSLFQEIEQGIGKFQNPDKKSFRIRFKEFARSTSIADDLKRYKTRVHELRLNFITSSVAQLNIHGPGSATQPSPPRSTTVCPLPSRIFHGRRDILDKMHEYFAQNIGNRHVCLLHGLGGSGKTQVALKFLAESQSNRFTDVFFLDASTADTIQAGLKNIALTHSLGSDHEDASLWLASCTTEWLLILDNADDPKLNLFNFFPQSSRGNILITSRNPQLRLHAPGAHHRISDLEEEAAVQLLLVSSAEPVTSETEMLATEIVKVLNCFPLAVIQAGAYISKTGSLRRYIALYEQNQGRLLSEVPVQSQDKYAWSVYTTWDISFKCLSKVAARFLQLCSFLHHEGISEGIFSNAAIYSQEILGALGPTQQQMEEPQEFLSHFLTAAGTWDTLSFADMVAEVKEYSLINQDPTTGLFSIHPLVHSWSRNTVLNMDPTRECTAALLAMSVSWGDQLFTMRLLPHINTVLWAGHKPATQFLYPYQWVYHVSGNFRQAQELGEDVLEMAKCTLGVEHPQTLDVMTQLANTYRGLGRLTDAEALQLVVLEKRKQYLGPKHPRTVNAMVNLANTYRRMGRLQDAEELQLLVLEKMKVTLGTDLDTLAAMAYLAAMAHLAATYRDLGRFTDTEELEVVVLDKMRQTLGPDHPNTLHAMGNLAATYRGLGKLTEAEALEEVVLENRMKTLGPEHRHTLLTMGNLAATYISLGKLTDAEALEVAVLEKMTVTLGTEHPNTLIAMGNLAETYRALGKLTDAEALEVVVLEKSKRTLGPEHPDNVIDMQNLATTYWHLGKLRDAEELEVVVLEKRRQTLGAKHPATLTAMKNLAVTYRDLGKLADAEELELAVLDKRRQILGADHPDTLTAMGNLASTYRALRNFTDAQELDVVVLKKRRQALGPDHCHTLKAMAGLAKTYRGLGRLTDAEELEEVVLKKRRQTLGPENLHTLNAMAGLAKTYRGIGRLTDAEELENAVLKNRRQTLGETHPDTLCAIANLAATYRRLGKLEKSEAFGLVVLEQRKKILVPKHPDTLKAMVNLAATYQDLGKFSEAKQLLMAAIEVRTHLFGPTHPDTVSAQHNLLQCQNVTDITAGQ